MQSLSDLIVAVSETVSVLNVHIDQAGLAQRAQAETTESALRLERAISDLVAVTHEEMERINATAATMRAEWSAAGRLGLSYLDWRYWNDWSKYGALWLAQVMFKGQ